MSEWLDMEWLEILSVFASVSLLAYVYYRLKVGPRLTKHQQEHRNKEQKMLNYILDDIQANTHEWTPVEYNMNEMKDASLVNDKKNMAVILHSTSTEVIIKINIKSAHKYKEESADTIATHIKGDHVTDFRQLAEQYIDSRGKELDFIDELLKKKI